MAGGIDKLASQLAEMAEVRAHVMYDSFAKIIDSPIERLFLVGLYSKVESGDALCFNKTILVDGQRPLSEDALLTAMQDGMLMIQLQLELLDWRADFVLSAPKCSSKKLIIECDGHDFHERTKDQAARDRSRDRSAVAAGHRILRYTGSELYRDPMKCVSEAINQAIWLVTQ